jgi:hypothetical protein
MTYDEAEDSRLSYDVAIAEIRRRKIASGEIVVRPGDYPEPAPKPIQDSMQLEIT